MSVLNDGNNLPGTLIDIESEVSQDYDPSLWGTTESVLVIGTAFQGPTGEAVRIYNADMGRYFFGNTYDTKTHRSASLVAGIQAAYDRGCRTIYAMRVGGKDIYKDFRLCESNTPYRLRIASVFPTNTAKQCYVKINVNAGEEAFEFYKPASRATISETKQGIAAASDATIKTTGPLNQAKGLTRNDKLTELIRLVNGNVHNNVLEMSIVDEDGNDMTTAPDAQELRIGSLFSGVYFIGRDKNSKRVPAYTIADARAVVDGSSDKPYSDYKGKFYRFLNINTDVSSDYPIGSFSRNDMKKQLAEVVTFGDDYDFLAVTGQADKAWMPDETDYEEAELSNYDLYERLGSGFAITAQAIPRGLNSKGEQRKPRIIETPSGAANHIAPLNDGLYSIRQSRRTFPFSAMAMMPSSKQRPRLTRRISPSRRSTRSTSRRWTRMLLTQRTSRTSTTRRLPVLFRASKQRSAARTVSRNSKRRRIRMARSSWSSIPLTRARSTV